MEDKGYREALLVAEEKFLRLENLVNQCKNAGVEFFKDKNHFYITVPYLDNQIKVKKEDNKIVFESSKQKPKIWEKILILHYLCKAQGVSLSNQLISFKHLQGGEIYFSVFEKRVKTPLLNLIKDFKDPFLIRELFYFLNPELMNMGDLAIKIYAFPHVPICYVWWFQDEEFPTELNILFDSTVSSYLDTEDVVVLCQAITFKVINKFKEVGLRC